MKELCHFVITIHRSHHLLDFTGFALVPYLTFV